MQHRHEGASAHAVDFLERLFRRLLHEDGKGEHRVVRGRCFRLGVGLISCLGETPK